MKKLLILLLCLSLIATCFIGCDSEDKKLDNKNFSSGETSSETSAEMSAETTKEETTTEGTTTEETTTEETTTEIIETTTESETVELNTTESTESEETEKETFKLPDDAPYSIEKIGNQSYLIFDYDESIKDEPDGCVIDLPFLDYSSLDELRKTVTSGKLEVERLESFLVKHFPRDENGFKIIDFNEDLYYPAYLPDGWNVRSMYGTPDGVEWIGSSYRFNLRHYDKWSGSSVEIFTKESYAEYCEKFGPSENARTIQKDGKKIIVDLRQFTKADSTTYYSLHLFMEENDTYSVWYLTSLDEIPSDDYLLSFGLDKYVAPTDNPN